MPPLSKSAAQEMAVANSQRQLVAALDSAAQALNAVLQAESPAPATLLIDAGRAIERLLRQYGGKFPDRLRDPCELARRAIQQSWPGSGKYLQSARAWLAHERQSLRADFTAPTPIPVQVEQADSFAPVDPVAFMRSEVVRAMAVELDDAMQEPVLDSDQSPPISSDSAAESHAEKDSE